MRFLDTNAILRFLTRDNPQQSAAVGPLFQRIDAGDLEVTTSESILVEVVQVLSSRVLYNLPRPEVRRHLEVILDLRGLKLPEREVYRRALELYEARRIDFVDALTVAQMERQAIGEIISFDRDFDAYPTISRLQPGRDPI